MYEVILEFHQRFHKNIIYLCMKLVINNKPSKLNITS